MSSGKVFFTPQCGRSVKAEEEQPWGTTSSAAAFRGYEPAEMRNCRSQPTMVKPALESSSAVGSYRGGGGSVASSSRRRRLPGVPEGSMAASAVTCGESAYSRGGSAASGSAVTCRESTGPYKVPYEVVHGRPIPKRNHIDLASTAHADQLLAAEARRNFFPYRDEYAPRSKRLLYEMALEKCTRDSVKSASTVPSVVSLHSRASSRSSSCPSLHGDPDRIPTGDSRRVIGGIAQRRREANLKAPMLWPADEAWFKKTHAEEGPVGLVTGQYLPSYYDKTHRNHLESLNTFNSCLDGVREGK